MHLDVLDLRTFYYRTRLGRAAQKAIRDRLVELSPPQPDLNVVGFGFAAPLLRPYMGAARRVVALMPGQQGVMPWPAGMPNLSVLCEETHWPLQSGMADRLILLHGLETSENPARLLGECWRVLAPGGSAWFLVPNRAGLWSRSDRTPFGFGRPYSVGQLEAQLTDNGFAPRRHAAALFQPPSEKPFWMRAGGLMERSGRKISNRFAGGVLLVEAVKEVRQPTGLGAPARERRPLRVLDGVPARGIEPA